MTHIITDLLTAMTYFDDIAYSRQPDDVTGLDKRLRQDIEALKRLFNVTGDYFEASEQMKRIMVDDCITLHSIVITMDITADYFEDIAGSENPCISDELMEIATVLKAHFNVDQD